MRLNIFPLTYGKYMVIIRKIKVKSFGALKITCAAVISSKLGIDLSPISLFPFSKHLSFNSLRTVAPAWYIHIHCWNCQKVTYSYHVSVKISGALSVCETSALSDTVAAVMT